MKRLLLAIIFTFFLFLTSVFHLKTFVKAQDFDYNRAFQDYQYIYSQYHQAHKEYVNARSAYLNYQTLTSKAEAQEKTLKMLQFRDEVARTYLTAIRSRLAEAEGVSTFEKEDLNAKIDNQIAWYVDHRESLTSAGTLEDLFNLSAESQGKWPSSQAIAYQTLGTILIGKEDSLREQIKETINQVELKLAEIRLNGDKKTDVLERWLLEARNRFGRSQEKQLEAQQIVVGIGSGESYNQARFRIQESHQYLKETNSYLREIIREVKIAD